MIAYDYPVISGYSFNIYERLGHDIGIIPNSISNVQINGVLRTVLLFEQEVTGVKKSIMDYDMISGAIGYPPSITGSTVYLALDLFENRNILLNKWGNSFTLYWASSQNDGNFDQIYVYFDKSLSQSQKNNVQNSFGQLISGIN